MTADAKVGLLLGLLFILLIAFVINGLPNFCNGSNSNELTMEKSNWQSGDFGLKSQMRKSQVIDEVTLSHEAEPVVTQRQAEESESSARYRVSLDSNEGVEHRAVDVKVVMPSQQPVNGQGSGVAAEKPALSKYYVVKSGDSLAAIAKKFYGVEQGNKRDVIAGLYKANKEFIKSADDIRAGQKLVIPPLGSTGEVDGSGLLDNPIFEKVKSIGRSAGSAVVKKNGYTEYTVKQGDCLEKIAVKELGNGSRYVEIVKLNSDVLDDEDSINIGMVLKIPAL